MKAVLTAVVAVLVAAGSAVADPSTVCAALLPGGSTWLWGNAVMDRLDAERAQVAQQLRYADPATIREYARAGLVEAKVETLADGSVGMRAGVDLAGWPDAIQKDPKGFWLAVGKDLLKAAAYIWAADQFDLVDVKTDHGRWVVALKLGPERDDDDPAPATTTGGGDGQDEPTEEPAANETPTEPAEAP